MFPCFPNHPAIFRSVVGLPSGAYHHANYFAENVTLNGSLIATTADLGSVGGVMEAGGTPAARYQPTPYLVNGVQVASFADLAADGFTDYLVHDAGAAAFPMGADDDDPFSAVVLFRVEKGTARALFGTMAVITSSGHSGFFARIDATGTFTSGMTPTGDNTWKGLFTSGVLSDGWHVAYCEWGAGTYAVYIDDHVTAAGSGSYTYAGTGGPPTASLQHGTVSAAGTAGLGGLAVYERKLTPAERLQAFSVLRESIGLGDWIGKAALINVADAANLTISGTDVQVVLNQIQGGTNLAYSGGAPMTYPQFEATGWTGGKGQIACGNPPPYWPTGSIGNFTSTAAIVVANWSSDVATSNRPIIGGGTGFALATSTGVMSVFDGAYKTVTGATVAAGVHALAWRLTGETSALVAIDGVEIGTVALDGDVGSDNLSLTLMGYNKSSSWGAGTKYRAVGLVNQPLTDAEWASMLAWGEAQK